MSPFTRSLVRRHLGFGWWSLLVFLSLGIGLEVLHGFKVDFYLNAAAHTRRFLWTLSHAHGTVLSLVHIAFAGTLKALNPDDVRWQRMGSSCLMGASVLIPGGFFLGGLFTHGGDPGLGILLLPVGALMLLWGVLVTARNSRTSGQEPGRPDSGQG